LKDVTFGFNGDYLVHLKKWKSAQIGARLDQGKSHALLVQNIDVDSRRPGVLALQWWHSPDANTELGLLANVDKSKTSLEYGLQKKVQWSETVFGNTLNLDHTLKAHIHDNGSIKLLLQKKLTENLKLHWTVHHNLFKEGYSSKD